MITNFKDVLDHFDGTFLLVSHDRYLIQALATHVWAIEDGQLHVLKGSWQEYVAWRIARQEAIAEATGIRRQDQREAQRNARRQRKQREKMEVRQREVEEEIARLEEQMETLSQRISQAGEAQDVEQVQALGVEYSDLEAKSQDLWNEWEVLSGELEDNANRA